jgi:anhydro-N-acetylmuramic acid kinase
MSDLYIGLMSGTSLDGVDVALCAIEQGKTELKDAHFIPFDTSLKERLLQIMNGKTTLQEIGSLDVRLAHFFAKGVNELLSKASLSHQDIVAIGSHGQTLWHEPKSNYPFSMQLGNPSVLAVETGIDVVADFRSKDLALGGEGAPFAPAFHFELFGDIKECAVVNIGGMANISLFSPTLIGYDSGCGNVLMDLWINEVRGEPFDRDGCWAASGKVNQALLTNMLEDNYFKLNYPKSTGREYFNKTFLRNYLEPFDKISDEEIQATLLALTVHSIANEIKKFEISTLLVCGGGVKNRYLMSELQRLLVGIKVCSTDQYGVSSENMEAMIFAWLAYKRIHHERVALKSITGAKKNTILGGIYASD